MSTEYVKSTGLEIPDYADIKTDLETDFKAIFGNDIDVSSDSVIGQIIAIVAKYISNNYTAMQEVYTSRDPQFAEGVNLDAIVGENGIVRLSATPTTIENVLLFGDDGTLILSGKLAKIPSGSVNFSLDSNVTISKSVCRKGYIEVGTVLDSTLYTIDIDGDSYTYTSDGTATATEILTGLKADIDSASIEGLTVTITDDVMELSNDSDFAFDVDSNLAIVEVGSAGNFTCVENGANRVPAQSLTEIVTPVTGWNSVLNESVGVTGRATETDENLRIRREQSVNGIGNATEDSLLAKIYDEVDGVTGVNVYSNRTDSTDSENRPSHSFEVVVSGGDIDDIANKIWEVQPAGIQSTGNINADGSVESTIPGEGINITDSQGYTQNVKFSRPVEVYIYVRVARSLYDEEVYPDDGDDQIKSAIVDWSLELANINVGKDVIRQRLSIPIYSIPGIEDIEIELDSSTSLPHTPSYSAANIVIGDRQVAVFAVGRIEVVDL